MGYKIFSDIKEIPENYKYIDSIIVKDGEEVFVKYIAKKEKNKTEENLNDFIEKYKYPALIKPFKTVESYKIIKGVSHADLLEKLKNFEDNLKDKWKIISDIQIKIIKGIKIYFVEIAKINYEFLENL